MVNFNTLKLLCFFALLGVAGVSHAQSQRLSQAFVETIQELGAANQKSKAVFCRENPIEFNTGEDQTDLINNCMESLCGRADQNPTTTLTSQNISKFVDRESEQDLTLLREQMESSLTSEQDRNQRFIKRARRLMKKGELKLTPTEMYPEKWTAIVKNIYAPLMDDESDPDAPRSQRLQMIIKPEVRQAVKEEHLPYLEDYIRQYQDHVNNGPWYIQVQEGLTSLEETKSDLRKNFLQDRQIMQLALDNDRLFKRIWGGLDQERYEFLEEAMENLDDYSLEDLRRITNLYVETYSSLTQTPPVGHEFCSSGPCRAGINEYLQGLDIDQVLQDIEGQNNEASISEVMRQCRFMVYADNILKPDSDKIRAAYPEVLEKFNQNVLNRFSEHSRQQFNQLAREQLRLDDINYEETNIEDDLLNNFESIERRNSIEVENDLPIGNSEIFSWLFNKNTLTEMSYEQGIRWQVSPFQDINPCGTTRPSLGGDSFSALADKNKNGSPYQINISAHSSAHLHEGKATLAHELGHFLGRLFFEKKLSEESKEQYLSMRQCSSLAYKNLPKLLPQFAASRGGFEGDTIKTEEDTADLIGVMAMGVDLEKPPGSCALLRPNHLNSAYDHQTLLSHPDSEHSSAPLRVLMESIHQKRPLSPGCRELILSNIEEVRFGQCF